MFVTRDSLREERYLVHNFTVCWKAESLKLEEIAGIYMKHNFFVKTLYSIFVTYVIKHCHLLTYSELKVYLA